jgi:tetratricopeptide (TPR) repeat protein
VLDLLQKDSSAKPERVAKAMENLAVLAREQGKYDQSEQLSQQAIAMREKAGQTDEPDFVSSIQNLEQTTRAQGKFNESNQLLDRAMNLQKKHFGDSSPEVATTINDEALLAAEQAQQEGADATTKQAQLDKATTLFKQALTIRESSLGSEDPLVAVTLNDLARVYRLDKQYPQAEAAYKRVLTIREHAFGPDDASVAATLRNYALTMSEAGNEQEADKLNARAAAIEAKSVSASGTQPQ